MTEKITPIRPDAITQPPRPWERQDGESPESWDGFCIYRALEPTRRTLIEVARTIGKSRTNTERLAKLYEWVARARAWDGYLAEQQEAAEAEQAKLRRKRQADNQERVVRQQLEQAGILKEQALRILRRESTKPDNVGPDPRATELASKILERAVAMERLAVGLPTDVTQQSLALRKEVEETHELVNATSMIIAEHLCDDCRARVSEELRRLSRRSRRIAGEVAS